MRILLYSFLFHIFAFQYYSWRFPGMKRWRKGKKHGWNNNHLGQARHMQNKARGLMVMGQRLNNQSAMFKKVNGRKKRDLYEIFKIQGRA